MRSTEPTTLTLPPFRGAVRRIITINLAIFFALALASFALPGLERRIVRLAVLSPADVLLGHLWQLLTYSFINLSLLGTALGLLTLWFTASSLEDMRGSRWVTQLYYGSAVAGAALACLISIVPIKLAGGRFHQLGVSEVSFAAGVYGPLFAIIVAFGMLFADVEILFLFVLRMRVKYLVAIYVLVDVARLLLERDAFNALLQLCCGAAGWAFVRFASRRGVPFTLSFSERYYGAQNEYARWRRRRAARKFEVYMRKQNREVRFDREGRYVAPEDEQRDPNDRRWMN